MRRLQSSRLRPQVRIRPTEKRGRTHGWEESGVDGCVERGPLWGDGEGGSEGLALEGKGVVGDVEPFEQDGLVLDARFDMDRPLGVSVAALENNSKIIVRNKLEGCLKRQGTHPAKSTPRYIQTHGLEGWHIAQHNLEQPVIRILVLQSKLLQRARTLRNRLERVCEANEHVRGFEFSRIVHLGDVHTLHRTVGHERESLSVVSVEVGEFGERRRGKYEAHGREVVGHGAEEGERLERGLAGEKVDEGRVVVHPKFELAELEGGAFEDPGWWRNN
jgi:hypothetical protein